MKNTKEEKETTETEREMALIILLKLYESGKLRWNVYVKSWNAVVGMPYILSKPK